MAQDRVDDRAHVLDRDVVATGDGALELVTVQPAGKGAMDGAAFLRGARLEVGARLGDA